MSTPIALADVTVTPDYGFFNPPGKPNEFYGILGFGAASLKSYDTYGIPCPPPGDFGMLKGIIRIEIQRPPTAYDYVYDPTARTANPVAPNGTIRIYVRNGGAEFSGDVPVTALPVTVIGE